MGSMNPARLLELVDEIWTRSLGQSFITGAVLGLFLVIIKQSIPQKQIKLKYQISVASLILFWFLFILSFFDLNPFRYISNYIYSQVVTISPKSVVNDHMLILGLWSLGSLFYLIRYFIVIKHTLNLKHSLSKKLPTHWHNSFYELKQYYNLTQEIILGQSDKVKSAFVDGIFKPMIVIPTSWVNQISPEEAKFILSHELAHLQSRDNLINVLVCVTEIIFYFNPATRYIINKLRFERELLADAKVIEENSNQTKYASLIVKLEEVKLEWEPIRIGFFQDQRQLQKRIYHILQIKHKALTKEWLLPFLVFSGILIFSYLPFSKMYFSKAEMNTSSLGEKSVWLESKLLAQQHKALDLLPLDDEINFVYIPSNETHFKPKNKFRIHSDHTQANTKHSYLIKLNGIKTEDIADDEIIVEQIDPLNSDSLVSSTEQTTIYQIQDSHEAVYQVKNGVNKSIIIYNSPGPSTIHESFIIKDIELLPILGTEIN